MKEVIDFYKDNPFNFSEDIKVYFDSIKNSNQVLEYEDLHKLLSNNFNSEKKNQRYYRIWLWNRLAY